MLEVRTARPDDAMGVAAVHVRAWQDGYRGLLPAQYLSDLRPEDRAGRYDFDHVSAGRPVTVVALESDDICGFATFGPARDVDAEGRGELLALYVDPGRWRRGVGCALISHARSALSTHGFTEAVLWMLAGNERAAAFYAADGWTPDGGTRQDEVWGVSVDELRYRRTLP